MTTAPYYHYKQFMIDTYGAPLYRVPIDLGLGCPHRDKGDTGGCAFCAEDGSRAPQTFGADSIGAQIASGLDFARSRYGATRFMAYLQAFTSTHAPPEAQQRMYRSVFDAFPFDAISIGTRPDCLPAPALALLVDLRRRTDVWVELGLQTCHDATLEAINRGHDWECSRRAVLALHDRGIKVAAHVILGLPGETPQHFRRTAEAIAALPVAAIKVHNLHVIRGTHLAEQWLAHPFPVYDEHDYASFLIDFLRRLPPRVGVIRISTDTPANKLIAPRWMMKKSQFADYVTAEMKRQGRFQGDTLSR